MYFMYFTNATRRATNRKIVSHLKKTIYQMFLSHKNVSHAINSHVLTGKNPCINTAIHVLLMHGFCTLYAF